MVSLKLGFVTAAVLASSLLVSAVPVPTWPPHDGPAEHRVEEGSVYTASPANFQPEHPGNTAHGGGTRHPVIAIGRTSPGGHVPAVSISHNHPEHMSDDVRPASDYDRYTRHAGHGQFQPGSQAAIGNPINVHHTDLHPPYGQLPHQLHHEDTRLLVEHVHQSSGYHSTNPHWPNPSVQQQTQNAPWRNQASHDPYGHQHNQNNAAAYPAAAYPGQHPHQQHAGGYGAYGQPAAQHPHAAAYPAYGQHPQAGYAAQPAAHPHQQAVYPPGHPYAGYPIPPHSGHSNGGR